MPKTQFHADMTTGILTVRREFAAARKLVWDCYTKAELLDRWYAPKPLATRTQHMDFREGGHWHFAMIDPDGNEYWSRSDYLEIAPRECFKALDSFCDSAGQLVEGMPQSRMEVTFADKGEHTLVQSVVRYASPEDLQKVIDMGMEPGLKSTLERLDELLLELA